MLNNLAALRAGLGQYDRAVPLYQRALDIVEKSEGPDSRMAAAILNNLAVCYVERKKYRQAEPLLLRSLRVEPTLPALETYATLLRKTKRAPQARQIEGQIRQLRSAQHPGSRAPQ